MTTRVVVNGGVASREQHWTCDTFEDGPGWDDWTFETTEWMKR